MRPFGFLRRLEKLFAILLDLTSLVGLGFSTLWIITFLTSSPSVAVTQNGVTIQGVPFSWVVYGLVATSAAHAYRSLKAFLRSIGFHDFLGRIELAELTTWKHVFSFFETTRRPAR